METTTVDFGTLIWTAVLSALPGILAFGWSAIQQFAKASTNTIDDKIVEAIEEAISKKAGA